MTPSLVSKAAAMLFTALLVLSAAKTAEAQTLIGGTTVLTPVSPPSISFSGANPTGIVNYMNNLNVTVQAIVIMVVRNSVGQAVYLTSATISPPGGGNSTAHLVEFGVPAGNYTATFFAFTYSTVAVSTSASAPFDLPYL